MKSDYYLIRLIITVWSKIINAHIGNFCPILSAFSLFKKGCRDYKTEKKYINQKSDTEKTNIAKETTIYGGETKESYHSLTIAFEKKREKGKQKKFNTKISFHDKTDSLDAAKTLKQKQTNAKIAIVNFANGVRVGGADTTGGKGSQEENIFRRTYLRISLEHAYKISDKETKAKTGRYIPYYGAIVSKNVPSFESEGKETFGYISSAAPDLRNLFYRSEGKYFNKHNDKKNLLVKEVLYRKITAIFMSAYLEGYDSIIWGAYGCGAFKNSPEIVAEVTKDILEEERFNGIFSKIVMPIGKNDKNFIPFNHTLST